MARFETTTAGDYKAPEAEPRAPWRRVHDIFLRLMSVIYLAWGLWEWASLIGLVPPLFGANARTNLPRQGATYFFAALDPVAAVGLWLGSAWGTATWLVVTFARIIIHTGYAGIFGWTGPWTILQVVSVLIYLVLFFLAERSDREAKKKSRKRPSV